MMTSKFFVVTGGLLIVIAVILKAVWLFNPPDVWYIKPSSLLILANISFVLALLRKK